MTKVQVSVVHDHTGRILSVSQFAEGVQTTILTGDEESVLVTTVDHEVVPELIHTRKIDVEHKRLIANGENVSGDPSDASRDRKTLSAMLLPSQGRD